MESWCSAPIYKGSGLRNNFENYRPIIVLSPISKIFEALVSAQMKYYFESLNI